MSDLDVKIYSINDTVKIEQMAYNKAIDELIMYAKLHRNYTNNTKDDCINFNEFIKFAEQLKERVKM